MLNFIYFYLKGQYLKEATSALRRHLDISKCNLNKASLGTAFLVLLLLIEGQVFVLKFYYSNLVTPRVVVLFSFGFCVCFLFLKFQKNVHQKNLYLKYVIPKCLNKKYVIQVEKRIHWSCFYTKPSCWESKKIKRKITWSVSSNYWWMGMLTLLQYNLYLILFTYTTLISSVNFSHAPTKPISPS